MSSNNSSSTHQDPSDGITRSSFTVQTYVRDTLPPLPEPHPNWSLAIQTWQWTWTLHVYGFGALYLIAVAMSVIITVCLNRRLRTRPLIGAMLCIICALSSCKAFALLIDPYHSTSILPGSVVQLTHGLTFPCVVASDTLLERALALLVRPRVSAAATPSARISRRVICVSILLYFLLVFAIYLTVSFRASAKHWLILTQMIFITWGFAVSFLVVFKCLKLSRYSRRSRKALQQILAYTKLKRHLERTNAAQQDTPETARVNGRHLSLLRISKTKLDVDDAAFDNAELESDRSSSDDSACYFNETYSSCYEEESRISGGRFHQRSQQLSRNFERPHSDVRNRTSEEFDIGVQRSQRGCFRGRIGANYSDYSEECLSDMSQQSTVMGTAFSENNRVSNGANANFSSSSGRLGKDVTVLVTDIDPLNVVPPVCSDNDSAEKGQPCDDDDVGDFKPEEQEEEEENDDGFTCDSDACSAAVAPNRHRPKITRFYFKRKRRATSTSTYTSSGRPSRPLHHVTPHASHVTHTNKAFDADSEDIGQSDFIWQSQTAAAASTGAWFMSDENVINEVTADSSATERRRINNKRWGAVTATEACSSGRSGVGDFSGYCFSNDIARRGDHDDAMTLCSVVIDAAMDVITKSGNNSDETETENKESCGGCGGGSGGVVGGGYLADTEIGSPRHKDRRNKDNVNDCKNGLSAKFKKCDGSVNDDANDTADSPRHAPFSLPLAGNCLGLHRILQGCVIRSVLRLTYAHVSGSFIICIIQVYAMFGVYGVLSNERVALPWPWYTFQTFARFSEVLFIFSLLSICLSVGRLRSRTAIRHRLKLKSHNVLVDNA